MSVKDIHHEAEGYPSGSWGKAITTLRLVLSCTQGPSSTELTACTSRSLRQLAAG